MNRAPGALNLLSWQLHSIYWLAIKKTILNFSKNTAKDSKGGAVVKALKCNIRVGSRPFCRKPIGTPTFNIEENDRVIDEMCWENIVFVKYLLAKCLSAKCLLSNILLAKCLLAKCLLARCLFTKCLLVKCLLAKCLLGKSLLAKMSFSKMLYYQISVVQMSLGQMSVGQMSFG